MGENSKIEWTDATWNPLAGCSAVSAGCTNCYAARMTKRLAAMGKANYSGLLNSSGHFNGKVNLIEEKLGEPLKRKKPTTYFVNSMSDLFHPAVPFDFIDKVFAVMALCPQHTFQVLTKRPERMAEYLNWTGDETADDTDDRRWDARIRVGCQALAVTLDVMGQAKAEGRSTKNLVGHTYLDVECGIRDWPLRNVWLGTSVENQAAADERIPYLLRLPAAVRFLSCEPLLGAVDLHDAFYRPRLGPQDSYKRLQTMPVNWVICGGESGPGARPMHPDWARGLRDQCVAAGVPFFFKQWGEWLPGSEMDPQQREFLAATLNLDQVHVFDGDSNSMNMMARLGKHAAGRVLDGRTWDEFPIDRRELTIPPTNTLDNLAREAAKGEG